jgi:hypothetical protein
LNTIYTCCCSCCAVSPFFPVREQRGLAVFLLVSDTCSEEGPHNLYLLQRWFPLMLQVTGGLLSAVTNCWSLLFNSLTAQQCQSSAMNESMMIQGRDLHRACCSRHDAADIRCA